MALAPSLGLLTALPSWAQGPRTDDLLETWGPSASPQCHNVLDSGGSLPDPCLFSRSLVPSVCAQTCIHVALAVGTPAIVSGPPYSVTTSQLITSAKIPCPNEAPFMGPGSPLVRVFLGGRSSIRCRGSAHVSSFLVWSLLATYPGHPGHPATLLRLAASRGVSSGHVACRSGRCCVPGTVLGPGQDEGPGAFTAQLGEQTMNRIYDTLVLLDGWAHGDSSRRRTGWVGDGKDSRGEVPVSVLISGVFRSWYTTGTQ